MRIAGGTAKRITKRIINFILVIWGVVTLSFCLQVFTGTDPAEMIVRKVNVFATEEQIQAVRESWDWTLLFWNDMPTTSRVF